MNKFFKAFSAIVLALAILLVAITFSGCTEADKVNAAATLPESLGVDFTKDH